MGAIYHQHNHPSRDYAQVPNAWARDRRLSRAARGLLVELLSHRDGWEISMRRLADAGPEGTAAIRAAVNQLRTLGYLQTPEARRTDGTYDRDWILTDPPSPGPIFATRREEIPDPTASGSPPVDNRMRSADDGRSAPLREDQAEKTRAEPQPSKPQEGRPDAASREQQRYLRDLNILGGDHRPGPELEEMFAALTRAEADAEIREGRAALRRGADYRGPVRGQPSYDMLSPSGQRLADARGVPVSRERHPAANGSGRCVPADDVDDTNASGDAQFF